MSPWRTVDAIKIGHGGYLVVQEFKGARAAIQVPKPRLAITNNSGVVVLTFDYLTEIQLEEIQAFLERSKSIFCKGK
jgi:hypothetical protein